MSDSNIGWIDTAKMKAALEALHANKKNAPKAKKAAAPADDLVDLFGDRVPADEAPAEKRGEAFIAAPHQEARPAGDDASVELTQTREPRPSARIQPEIPPDQVRAIARAAAPKHHVENPSSLDDAFDRTRETPEPSRESASASHEHTSAGLQDALSMLRSASPSAAPRHAFEELGYESALPELQRPPESAHTTPAHLDDDDDERLSLPVGDLDLHLRSSMSSVASIQPIRDASSDDALSEMLVFGEDDFHAPKPGAQDAGSDFSSAEPSKEPTTRSVPLRASAGFEAVGADETNASSDAPAPLSDKPGFTRAPSPGQGQTWERPEALMATREYRAVTDVEARADGIARQHVEPAARWQAAPEAEAPSLTRAPDYDEGASLRSTGAYPAVAAPPSISSPAPDDVIDWRNAPKPSDFESVLAWLEAMNQWCELIEPDSLFFVADEGGLPLMVTNIPTADIAIAVAMRQSFAALQALNHEEAPGFTVYRHTSGRYAHLLWAPSEYGVITLGILSARVHEDARLAVFSERLVAALNHLPLTH